VAKNFGIIIPPNIIKGKLHPCGHTLVSFCKEKSFKYGLAKGAIWKNRRGPVSIKFLKEFSRFLSDCGECASARSLIPNGNKLSLADRVDFNLYLTGTSLRKVSKELGFDRSTASKVLSVTRNTLKTKIIYELLANYFKEKGYLALAEELEERAPKNATFRDRFYYALGKCGYSLNSWCQMKDVSYNTAERAILGYYRSPAVKKILLLFGTFFYDLGFTDIACELRELAASRQDVQPTPEISKLKSFLHAILKGLKRFIIFLDGVLPGESISGRKAA